MGREMKIIPEILDAVPTDGLWEDGRTDEDQIGFSYDELEWAMKLNEIFEKDGTYLHTFTERQSAIMKEYDRRHSMTAHKMLAIPICKIPKNLN